MTTTPHTSVCSAFVTDPAAAAERIVDLIEREVLQEGRLRPPTIVFPTGENEDTPIVELQDAFASERGQIALIHGAIPALVASMGATVVLFIFTARPHSDAKAEMILTPGSIRDDEREWLTVVEAISSRERLVYAGWVTLDDDYVRRIRWSGPKRDAHTWAVPAAIQAALRQLAQEAD